MGTQACTAAEDSAATAEVGGVFSRAVLRGLHERSVPFCGALVVDELDSDYLRSSNEGTTLSLVGYHFEPVAQLRGASNPEAPRPNVGVVDAEKISLPPVPENYAHLHSRRLSTGRVRIRGALGDLSVYLRPPVSRKTPRP